MNQESQEVKLQLKTEQERVSDLLNKLKELEVKAQPWFPFESSGEQTSGCPGNVPHKGT